MSRKFHSREASISLIGPPHAARFWLSPHCYAAAWLGLSLALLTPPHGSGVTICWIKASTGIPCPGCGLTRSMSCALRGMCAESWGYHPMGMLVLLILLAVGAVSVLPKASKLRVRQVIEDNALVFKRVYFAFVLTFVSFGAIRALLHVAHLY